MSAELAFPVTTIGSIQYRILSPEEVRKMSYVSLENDSGIDNGIFKEKSAYDLLLGTISRSHRCKTCKATYKNESGHYSHIEFTKPVFNTIFIQQILGIIKCICFKCSGFLVQDHDYYGVMKLDVKKRLKKCLALTQKKPCHNCGWKNPTFKLKDVHNLIAVGETDFMVAPEAVRTKFSKLTDEQIRVLGLSPKYSRPEWMILKNLLVIPPTNRPIIQNKNGEKSEDSMFKLYTKIIKFNNTLKTIIEKRQTEITYDDYQKRNDDFGSNFTALSFAVSSLMTDKMTKSTKVTVKGSQMKSIKEELKGKEGHIRGKMMGKRVDYSARTVIGPEANFSVDEFGIPLFIAKKLTFPERVTQYNMDFLCTLIINGPDFHPGAESVVVNVEGKQEKVSLLQMTSQQRKKVANDLKYGYVVNRHMVDGDHVIFNRQPTLHKYGIMGVRARILPPGMNIIRLPFGSNKPFNADFDGDECQTHGPRSLTTANEIKTIMGIRNHFISICNSDILIAPLQDSVLAPHLMSKFGNILMDKRAYMKYLHIAGYFNLDSVNPKKQIYRLIEVVENLIPEDFIIKNYGLDIEFGKFNYTKSGIKTPDKNSPIDSVIAEKMFNTHKEYQDDFINRLIDEDFETIANTGKYSTITSKNIKEGFIRLLFNKYGPNVTNNFFAGLQKCSNEFLKKFGSTCSLRDIYIPMEIRDVFRKNITDVQIAVDYLLDELDDEKIIPPITRSLSEHYEVLIGERVNKYLVQNMDLLSNYMKTQYNNLYNMVSSGSKGSAVNITNLVDNIGQTSINGKRIEKAVENRTLVCYPKYAESYQSRGFIQNSYSSGINLPEFFFNQKGSRNGLIDTAIKVKLTGYATTRLSKSLEDIVIGYRNYMCRAGGRIISELFGGNGFNPMNLSENKFEMFKMNNQTFIEEYCY